MLLYILIVHLDLLIPLTNLSIDIIGAVLYLRKYVAIFIYRLPKAKDFTFRIACLRIVYLAFSALLTS